MGIGERNADHQTGRHGCRCNMTFTILASGSEGNAALLSTAHCNLLIDCGLPVRELAKRMAPVRPETIDALICTHEPCDHVDGIDGVIKHGLKYGRVIPVYVSSIAVRDSIAASLKTECPPFAFFEPGLPFSIGDIKIDPFTCMHDCAEGSVAFKFTADGHKIGFAIDLGFVPPAMSKKFVDCDTVVIESNYDPDLLDACDHPPAVKARVSGRAGHLSNTDCAEFLAGMNGSLKRVVLAHLSRSANRPALATSAALAALEWSGSKAEVLVASQTHPVRVL